MASTLEVQAKGESTRVVGGRHAGDSKEYKQYN